MRMLDRWIGIPLCWWLTLQCRVMNALRPSACAAEQALPRRIMFVLLSESGSMVLADPAIRAVTQKPDVTAHFLTFEHHRPALAITGTIPPPRIHSLRTDNLIFLALDFLRWRKQVRRLGIEAIVDLELFSRLSAVLCMASGIRQRVGFNGMAQHQRSCYRGNLYTHPVVYDPALHMAHNYLALTDALCGTVSDRTRLPQPTRHAPHPADIAVVRALLSDVLPATTAGQQTRLLLLNPNASEFLPQRRWPAAHFINLSRCLLERHADLHLLLIGSSSDAGTTAQIAADIANPRCADIAGRLPLAQLPALFSLADAMLSNDSGPAHFASVTTLPVLVLFGPETPARYRPLGRAIALTSGAACSPCVSVENQRQTSCRDNLCMRAISVDTVLETLEALLPANPGLESQPAPDSRPATTEALSI